MPSCPSHRLLPLRALARVPARWRVLARWHVPVVRASLRPSRWSQRLLAELVATPPRPTPPSDPSPIHRPPQIWGSLESPSKSLPRSTSINQSINQPNDRSTNQLPPSLLLGGLPERRPSHPTLPSWRWCRPSPESHPFPHFFEVVYAFSTFSISSGTIDGSARVEMSPS